MADYEEVGETLFLPEFKVTKKYINPYKSFRGAWVPLWLLERKELSASAKLVYACLSYHSGKNGSCFPKQETIGVETGMSARYVRKNIAELVKVGLIESVQQGENQPNIYFFLEHEWMNLEVERNYRDGPERNYRDGIREVKDKRSKEDKLSVSKNGKPDHAFVLETTHRAIRYLNKQTDSKFRDNTPATVRLVRARLNEGFVPDDFKTVIDKQCSKWLGTDMAEYLRPATLFGTKFEGYLNGCRKKKVDLL